VDENKQHDWYKQMYRSLHQSHKKEGMNSPVLCLVVNSSYKHFISFIYSLCGYMTQLVLYRDYKWGRSTTNKDMQNKYTSL